MDTNAENEMQQPNAEPQNLNLNSQEEVKSAQDVQYSQNNDNTAEPTLVEDQPKMSFLDKLLHFLRLR